MKIAVIALNPGIDRIIYLDAPAKLGTLNRAARTVVSQGSKGANVAIVLKNLGADPDYYTFTGGELGLLCEKFTDSYNIKSYFTTTGSGVRVNTKVIDTGGVCTEFNERGGPVSGDELETLLNSLFSSDYDLVITTGSIPQGVEKCVYNRIISHFNGKSAITVLDCDGEAMKYGLDAKPTLIKPNLRELAGIIGTDERTLDSDEKILSACRTIRRNYCCDILCTLEENGSIYCGDDGEFKAAAAKVTLNGFSGAGDTYLAAYLYKRYCLKADVNEALAYASAAAGAKVALDGTNLPDKIQIDNIYNRGIEITDERLI